MQLQQIWSQIYTCLLICHKKGSASKYPTIYIANRKTYYFILTAVKIDMFAIKFNIIHRFNTVKLLYRMTILL